MSTPPPPGPYGGPDPYGRPGQPPTPPPYGGPSGYAQPPAYGQQPPAYGQPPQYGQQPPSYGQQPSYGRPPQSEQPAYGQQPPYGQQPSYGQQTGGDGQMPAWGQAPPPKVSKPISTGARIRGAAIGVGMIGAVVGGLWAFGALFGVGDKGPNTGDCLNAKHDKVSCSSADASWKVLHRTTYKTTTSLNCGQQFPGSTPYDDRYRSNKKTTKYRLCLGPLNAAPKPATTAR